MERGFGRHANASNPYVAALLLGRSRETQTAPVTLETADAAEFLERSRAGSFDSFSLSNILDGADSHYARRLFAAVRRASTPGAVVVLRSFGEPATEHEGRVAASDRGLIWGSIKVER
jgi:S-adenosylmethionine:diacylglycerol 3-amino-3-carboxypropyl transferase